MTRIIVEDGSIVENANSYISLDEFKSYCNLQGIDISSYDDNAMETAIIRSCSYLNALPYMSLPVVPFGNMAFPRKTLFGFDDCPIPPILKTAQNWLSAKVLIENVPLYKDSSTEAQVQSEEVVGAVRRAYFEKADESKGGILVFGYINNLLSSILDWNDKTKVRTMNI